MLKSNTWKWLIIIITFFLCSVGYSQNRNSVWCFGDSAGINFNGGAIPIISGMDGRGSCVSMSSPIGNLLYYAATMRFYANDHEAATFVYNSNHQVMDHGDSIVGRVWYQELVSIPNPLNDSTYYLFSISVTGTYGIVYSLIDMKQNGGLGSVTQKNILLQTFAQVDCINTIKHGNGRDWWVFFRKSDVPTGGFNNDWYSYLVTPSGIQNFSVQSIGSQNRTNLGHITFSSDGSKMVFNNYPGVIELYDFDRCTGIISNPITIESDPGSPPYPFYWSNAFSPDDSKLYVTSNDDTCYLFQYDLTATNISATKDTLWTTTYPQYTCGGLKLAPDNKIYLSNVYYNSMQLYYPYGDSMYNMYNMNLSVINSPDSLSAACDFQPYSFYLGGKRTYLGLPNNPDYDMPAWAGSPCDTLVSINPSLANIQQAELFVFYHPGWQTAFINAQKLTGHNYRFRVFDIEGKEVFSESGKLSPPYFTKNLNCAGWAKGIYLVRLSTEKESVVKKFVIE